MSIVLTSASRAQWVGGLPPNQLCAHRQVTQPLFVSSIEREVIPISALLEFCGDHMGRFNGDVVSTVKQDTGVNYRDHFWLGMSVGRFL